MNLEYSDLRYNNYEHVNEENLLTFDLKVKDLDGGFLNGEEFDFTLVVSDDSKYNVSTVAKQILKDYKEGRIDISQVKEYDFPLDLAALSILKRTELREFKDELLRDACITFDSDVFDIRSETLARIASTIQSLLCQEANGKLDHATYTHKWVSQMKVVHEFTLDQLQELNNLMIGEIQTIILRYNQLLKTIPTITDKRELYFLDWYYVSDNDNQQ